MLNIKRDENLSIKKLLKEIDYSTNNIFIEDNIHTLNAIKESGKKIDLIYIDPPYNTKKNVFKYKDNRKTDEWITFIYERLILAEEILSDDGVILASIDDNHYAYLKLIMDEIFGLRNFVANFIWKKSHTVKNDKSGISTQQEYVLCFAKNHKKMFFNQEPIGEDYIKKAYRYKDEVGTYRVVPLYKDKNKTVYDIVSPKGQVWTKGWNYNKEGFENLIKNDLIYWGKTGDNCPSKKVYLKDVMEKSYGSMLPVSVGYTGDGKKALKNLDFHGNTFLYAKPVELIQHFLTIFSHKESLVLDFFAGSGTTGEAVINKNIEDGGDRKFILATNNEDDIADNITIPRIKRILEKRNIDDSNLSISDSVSFEDSVEGEL